ncbi:MAG: S8 family serine peptidase [Candidatus Cloacimonetes bacterium]|nr:S8 family serine peptidase [Candidatus Cloacimonadota bacterium]
MKRLKLIALLLIIISVATAMEYTPRQMLVKTSRPLTPHGNIFGLQKFDSFLTTFGVKSVEAILPFEDNRYFRVNLEIEPDWKTLLSGKQSFFGIEYFQPNYINKMHTVTPTDPYYVNQNLSLVNLPEAWEITTGNSQIIVAIIDSGCLFDHPDLQNNFFINETELNGVEGVDDDNNGYIDDFRGWDFSDAPELHDIALGDYMDQDNDATDENNHGTHVAGIIGADTNNQEGIAGICFDIRMLTIRAGFRTTEGYGYLQDDDCAASIVYAADSGADVINMSWGDNNYSQIIADACQYAYDQGSIMVASAGNNPVAGISYPSRLATVISVGAVDDYLNLTGFSSFGPNLDLVAPGQQILSTYASDSENLYFEQSGTSTAAPFVAGAVALLLSARPGLSYQEIRASLLTTAIDLGQPGFDNFYGNGLLDVYALLQITSVPQLEITYPTDFLGLSGSFQITGTADTENFFRYSLMYSNNEFPEEVDWRDVYTHSNIPSFHYDSVVDGLLADFLVVEAFPEGYYVLKLELSATDGSKYDVRRNIFIDQTPPELMDNYLFPYVRFEGELPVFYIQCKYNETVNLVVECRDESNQVINMYSDYADSLHILRLPMDVAAGSTDIKLHATNLTGLIDETAWLEDFVYINYTSIDIYDYQQESAGIALVCIPETHNREFVGMELGEGYGPVHFWEIAGNQLVSKHEFTDQFWPLDIGDTNGTGIEVLGLNLDVATLYETNTGDQYPDTLKLGPWTNVMGGNFVNFDDDPEDEIALVLNLPEQRVITLFDRVDDYFTEIHTIYNKTTTMQRNTFVPKVRAGDLDVDGRIDFLTADTDGDVMIYEMYGPSADSLIWARRLITPNLYYLEIGDFTGNRRDDFCVGGYVNNVEDPNKTFWYFEFYENTGDNQFESMGYLSFDQFESQNSVTTIDLDDDEDLEIILCLAPHVYVIDYIGGVFQPIWKGESSETYQAIALPADDQNEVQILINNSVDDSLMSYVITASAPFTGPDTPGGFVVNPVNEESARLEWQHGNADYYKLYRRLGTSTVPVDSVFADTTLTQRYIDSGLQAKQTYSYAISAVDNSLSPNESRWTLWKDVTPDNPPLLETIKMIAVNKLRITFDTKLHSTGVNTGYFTVNHDIGHPASTIFIYGGKGVILTFGSILQPQDDYSIFVEGLFSTSGVPFQAGVFSFDYEDDTQPPLIENIEIISRTAIEIHFSEDVSSETAGNILNYALMPPEIDLSNGINTISHTGSITKVTMLKEMEYSTQPYFIVTRNIEDLTGNMILNSENKKEFSLTEIRDLSYVIIAPNPFYTSKADAIKFLNLPLHKSGKLSIYDISGELVYESAISPRTEMENFFPWKGVNKIANEVSSGMYFYVLRMGNDYKRGRIAVIR